MKHLSYLLLAFVLIATSCTNQDWEQEQTSGKAKLNFRVATELPVIVTRATPVPDVDDLIVKISNGDAVVREAQLGELKQNSPLFLPAEESGTTYSVEAYSNQLEDVVLDKPCFYAVEDYTLMPDETVTVELSCSLQQFQVSFDADDVFKSSFRKEGFRLTVSDENGRSLAYAYDDLAKSVYFDAAKTSSYIKIKVEGTTVKGFPVDYNETILPEDGKLEAKDHLIVRLSVSQAETMKLKTIIVE